MRRWVVFVVLGVVVLLEVAAAVYLYNAVMAARQAAQGVNVGAVADFPPSETPYTFFAPDFYLVNTGGELIAFAPYETNDGNQRDCRVDWLAERATFRDPCLGATYTLDGHRCDGPANRDLDRYALVRVEGQVWVNPQVEITGAPAETGPDGSLRGGCPVTPASQTN